MSSINSGRLRELVEAELAGLTDSRVIAHLRGLLVPPAPVMRDWDYGEEGEAYPCWSVLEHPASNTGISYCESGFGPRSPWGLVVLSGTQHMSIGMDAGWFRRLLGAYFESQAATELPIWRVFQDGPDEPSGRLLTAEGAWESTWAEVMRLRSLHPGNRYHCRQFVYPGED